MSWDDGCGSDTGKIVYGPLSGISIYASNGAICDTPTLHFWDAVPSGNIWFLVIPQQDWVDGSWGEATSGERNGLGPSL